MCSKARVFADVEAAASVNTALALSTMSTATLEEVSDACSGSACFLQLYVCRDRDVSARLVRRAERAGYSAVVLTVDAPTLGKRRAQFMSYLPPHIQ